MEGALGLVQPLFSLHSQISEIIITQVTITTIGVREATPQKWDPSKLKQSTKKIKQ